VIEHDLRGVAGNCPACGHLLDADGVALGEDARPTPGDVSVCMYCTSFLVFEPDLSRRAMTDDEVGELPDDVRMELIRVRRTIKSMKKGR